MKRPARPQTRPSTKDCDNLHVHKALKPYFSYCLYKSALHLRERINTALADHGIIATQLGILRLLSELGPISQNELGQEMGVDKASMVKFIDGLEAKKLVTRAGSTKDRRVKFIHITKPGLKLLTEATRLRADTEDEFLAPLTATEKAQLRKILPKLLK